MIATIGYGYLPHLAKIRERVELTAIANRGLEKGRAVAEAHGIAHVVGPWTNCSPSTSMPW